MYRLLFLPFFALLFFGCDDSSDEVDPLFYQISEADSVRCMGEILDGILEDAAEAQRFEEEVYESGFKFFVCDPIEGFRVKLNNQKQSTICNDSDSTNLTERTFEYFIRNRNLTADETRISFSRHGFDYAFYNLFELEEILDRIAETQIEADQIRNIAEADAELVEYYASKVTDWEMKKKALELIEAPALPQIASWAYVRFVFMKSSSKSKEILNEIALAFYQMRNYESLHYFNESYLSLYERAQRRKRKLDLEKLAVLKLLHPASINCRDLSKTPKFEIPQPPELIEPPKPQKP